MYSKISSTYTTVICHYSRFKCSFLFSFFVFDCSIIVTTVQYLSSALHKNFTETDFDFKVRIDTQKMLWHLFKLAVTKEQELFSTLADYICSIYLSVCEEDDLTDKRQELNLLWNWGEVEQILWDQIKKIELLIKETSTFISSGANEACCLTDSRLIKCKLGQCFFWSWGIHDVPLPEVSLSGCWLKTGRNTVPWRVFSLCLM